MAFQRFFSRRGLPERIHSDNALYFTSTAKTFEESSFTITEIQKYAESKKIAWKFIPPGAAHFGGTWERLIGMSKRLFFNSLCQVEALLNSRALTSVSSDVRDVESLTPGHFLTGMTTGVYLETTISSNDREAGKLWNNVNSIMNEFWTRLLKDYLPTLRQRRKWHSTVDGTKVGDMVWILENNTPRGICPHYKQHVDNQYTATIYRQHRRKTSAEVSQQQTLQQELLQKKQQHFLNSSQHIHQQ
ncbi:uncharacterized protein LOC142352862 [Convolutriloba macropyga]|uniref:uncharacterized protein LOC142352862 n=1 Tax=Convolutriloba macropyga TaxID=536237 RepID=UPI003F51E4BC